MEEKFKHCKYCYILVTSLFYPAVLGAIFYFLIDGFPSIVNYQTKIYYILTSLAIVISFSIDFLYTYAASTFYNRILFISDLIIIFLLLCSYKSLLSGIKTNSPIPYFFICFFLIHVVFIFWDLFFIPKERKSLKIIFFDIISLVITIIAYFQFREIFLSGVIYLWCFAILYILICWKEINYILKSND